MAVSYVQGKAAAANTVTSPQDLVFGSNNTLGNCIVVYVVVQDATTLSSVTDSNGNVYTQVYKNVATGGTQVESLFYALNIAGGANTVHINLAANNWTVASVAQEFSGVATATALDTNNHVTINSWANPQSGASVTTANANDVIVGGFFQANGSTFSLGTGFSNLDTAAGGNFAIGMESKVVAATGTYQPTMGTNVIGFAGDAVTLALEAGNSTTTSTSSTSSSTSISTSSTSSSTSTSHSTSTSISSTSSSTSTSFSTSSTSSSTSTSLSTSSTSSSTSLSTSSTSSSTSHSTSTSSTSSSLSTSTSFSTSSTSTSLSTSSTSTSVSFTTSTSSTSTSTSFSTSTSTSTSTSSTSSSSSTSSTTTLIEVQYWPRVTINLRLRK